MRFYAVCALVIVALQFASGWGDVGVIVAGLVAV